MKPTRILVWHVQLKTFIANLILKEGKTKNDLPLAEKYDLIYLEVE